MGITSDTPIADAITSIETVIDGLTDAKPSTEIVLEIVLIGTYVAAVTAIVTAASLWERAMYKKLQIQMVRLEDISKRSDSHQTASLGLRQVKCPEYKELLNQFKFNASIFKRIVSDLANNLKSVNRKAYQSEFAKIGMVVDLSTGNIEGKGNLSLEKNFLNKKGYTIKNILGLLKEGLSQSQTVKGDLTKIKVDLNKLSKLKNSNMAEDELTKFRGDAKFVVKALKKSISNHKKDIRLLKRVAWAVPGISHNANINVS